MNSCILMAEIVQEPQLRYTQENNNLALAEMRVQIPGQRSDDPPATLKVVGWGGLAQEIEQNYHQGDRVIIEGRLSMNTFERADGVKEKRAELTVQRIHPLGNVNIGVPSSAPANNTPTPTTTAARTSNPAPKTNVEAGARRPQAATAANTSVIADFYTAAVDDALADEPIRQAPPPQQDIDEIPF